jgi:hypothetical protein
VWYAYDAAKQDLQKVAADVRVIERFSDEYFELIRRNPAALNRVLAGQQSGEEMVIQAPAEAAEEEPALVRIK